MEFLIKSFKTCCLLGLFTLINSCDYASEEVDPVTEYKIDANASLPTNGNRILGYVKAKQNQPFPAFDFEITDPTGIKIQTYAEPNIDMIFRIALEGTKTYHSQSGGVEDFKISITEITNNHIKGTFSGSVFLAQTTGIENFKLTDGEFFLKRDLN